jgi:hypothetical protein
MTIGELAAILPTMHPSHDACVASFTLDSSEGYSRSTRRRPPLRPFWTAARVGE